MSDIEKATPRPWRAVYRTGVRTHLVHRCPAFGPPIGSIWSDADAALIVQAVNERDELIAALRNLVEEIETDGGVDTSAWPLLDEARAVLAKVSA